MYCIFFLDLLFWMWWVEENTITERASPEIEKIGRYEKTLLTDSRKIETCKILRLYSRKAVNER